LAGVSINKKTGSTFTTLGAYFYSFSDLAGCGRTGARIGENDNNGARLVNYSYDRLFRLRTEQIGAGTPNGTIAYDSMDMVGNRLHRQSGVNGVPTASYTYNNNDRLTTTGTTYDSNGNTITSGGFSYGYDFENRLVSRNGTPALSFAYDHDGNRVKKTVGSSVTYYLVDEQNPTGYPQVVEELSAIGANPVLLKTYTYGLKLISQKASGTTQYYGHDGHGNVRLLLNTSGDITQTYDYDSFGILISASPPLPATGSYYLYCGEQFDVELGLHYLRARYYSSQTGRFWTMDKREGYRDQPKSLHHYTYAEDDPLDNVDPSGEEIEGLLTVMSVSTTLFSQRAPTTTKASIYSVAWGASRALTTAEIGLARTIYKGNIDYTKTGVDYGKWKFFQTKGREMTPDGIIHTGGETISDYTVPAAKPGWPAASVLFQKGILIHELCHVWQYQHGDNVVLRGLYRNYNYAGPNFGKTVFSDYGIEQQAQMTEDYFYLRNGNSSSPTIPRPTPALATYEKILPFLK
ncbi:MAG TPA: RHS repeat-associated core domain-containing protein, partial [Verrucomicrobiae bacterium]